MPYPKKSLGQNFLINAGVLEKIVSAAELSPNDTVLEIGPGTGNLTKLLSEKVRSTNSGQAGRVIAVEKDHRLIGELKEKFKNTNVEVIEGDILNFTIESLMKIPRLNLVIQGLTLYKVVANIPYYITSHLLKTIFEEWPRPELIILTVQKEVAQRIVAKPPNMNLLALSVQLYSDVKIICYVSRGSFRPTPKVDSAIIKLTPHQTIPLTTIKKGGGFGTGQAPHDQLTLTNHEIFFKLIKAGFSGKRKQLINNLAKNFGMIKDDLFKIFKELDIRHDVRAENLSLSQWTELSKFMEK